MRADKCRENVFISDIGGSIPESEDMHTHQK